MALKLPESSAISVLRMQMKSVLLQDFHFGLQPKTFVPQLLFEDATHLTGCEKTLLPETQDVLPPPLVNIVECSIPKFGHGIHEYGW